MAFYVVDYKDVKTGEQGKTVFTHRLYKSCVKWLNENATEQELYAGDRYVLDGDEDSWRRKFG